MDVDEFPTSPAKRQRTGSPEETINASENLMQTTAPQPSADSNPNPSAENDMSTERHNPTVPADNGFLDVLMQHVEAESAREPGPNGRLEQSQPHGSLAVSNNQKENVKEDSSQDVHGGHLGQEISLETSTTAENIPNISSTIAVPSSVPGTADSVDATPPDNTLEPEHGAEGPEWEIDSSPYESSSDSDSDTTSDDSDDDDADGDYAMLDPEEQARILMQGDGGSDDEGGRPREKGDNAPLRTANEKPEEIIPKPDIVVTEDMQIEELGNVEAVVEGTVLVKAKISGEYQVLESGSVLCLKDRSVVGVVSETLGRVEQPLYTVRFTDDAAIEEAGLSKTGTTVYYVRQHSTFVFTQPLKSLKGSDASNFHDEEVGDDEMEFSDDEAEAEYKRQLKMKRQGRRAENDRGRGGRNGRGGFRGNRHGNFAPIKEAMGEGSGEMNYDDVAEGGEDGYTPLARPTNLHEMMGHNDPREESSLTHPLPPMPSFRGRGGQNRGRDRGRGGRGGNRGGRGGGYQNHGPNHFNNNSSSQNSYQSLPPPFSLPNHQFSSNTSPPNAPTITPQNAPFSMPFSPSPISPLPKQQFNFSGFSPNGPPPPPPGTFYPGMPPPQGYHQQHLAPGFMPAFAAPQQQQQQQNFFPPPPAWAGNQAAAAQVQRQLEELQRNQNAGK